ncbi:MAG: 3-hydroxylacyl-ACP dehydratase [Desulfobulbaceae bacterium]|nr:3-hydroxylacyl-ACP dehydratase [Desulfobulbaceae bacterium]
MDVANIPVRELLPHDPPMVLLDKVISCAESSLVAEVVVKPESMFCDESGVPAWVGIEYMAQSVAAHAGAMARQHGGRPVIGYLLGTRSYKSAVSEFPIGATLKIVVEPLFVETGLGAFACRIDMGDTVAEATINVYQPGDDSPGEIDTGTISG